MGCPSSKEESPPPSSVSKKAPQSQSQQQSVPAKLIRPPFPPILNEMLSKCRLAYFAISDENSSSHLCLMRFTYVQDEELIIMTSNRNTKKFGMISKQRNIAMLIHNFSQEDNNNGVSSVTMNGECTILDGSIAEKYRAIHLKHNPDYPQFIVGDDISVICVNVSDARICDIQDKVVTWSVGSGQGLGGSSATTVPTSNKVPNFQSQQQQQQIHQLKRQPFPPILNEMLSKCRLAYFAISDENSSSHLCLMRFTYVQDEELIIMTSNRNTKKFDMISKQRNIAMLIHNFSQEDNNNGVSSITMNGECTILDGSIAEKYRAIHLKHNLDYPQFIVGDDISVICVNVSEARICDIQDKVVTWNAGSSNK